MNGYFAALAITIAVSLLVVLIDRVIRPGRRRRYAAQRAARRAAQDAPIPGLAEAAAAEGWRGPLPAADTATDETRTCISKLLLGLHGELNPDRGIRSRARLSEPESYDSLTSMYSPMGLARLTQCYGGDLDGRQFTAGNAFAMSDVEIPSGPPAPLGDELAGAFCTVAVSNRFSAFRIVPDSRRRLLTGRKTADHPALDGQYTLSYAAGPLGAGLLNDGLATHIASRGDWAFALYHGVLICATFQPLRSSQDAKTLAAATVKAAALLPKAPSWPDLGFR